MERSQSLMKSLMIFFKVAQNRIYLLFFLVLIGFLGRAFLLAMGNVLAEWVDYILYGTQAKTPFLDYFKFLSQDYIVILIIFFTLGLITTWIYRIGFSDLCALIVSKIHDELVYRVSRFSINFFDRYPVGKIVTRFASDYGNVFRLFGGPLAEFLSIIFDLLLMCILLSMKNYYFLPFLLMSIFLHWLIYLKWKKNLRHHRRLLSQNRAPGISFFAETLQGALNVRLFEKEENFIKQFIHYDQLYLNQKYATVKNLTKFNMSMNWITFILYGALGLFSWYGLEKGFISLGEVGLVFGIVALSGHTIQNFFEWLAQFEEAMVGLERLDEYFHIPLESGAYLPVQSQFSMLTNEMNKVDFNDRNSQKHSIVLPKLELEPKIGMEKIEQNLKIEFKNVWFRYQDDLPWVLKNISFHFKAGKFGLIGATGAGKSSLIQCLFYLYPIQKGSIHIGPYTLPYDQNYSHQSLDDIRSILGYIPQDPFILKGNLRQNLDPEGCYSDDWIKENLIHIGCDFWVHELDRSIEEKGRNLSFGEKQLIQIARVFIQNKNIVIMDEATSNIDPVTEQIISKVIEDKFKSKLLIIIAHRLNTIRLCDQVIWLKEGQIAMAGSPSEVINAFMESYSD